MFPLTLPHHSAFALPTLQYLLTILLNRQHSPEQSVFLHPVLPLPSSSVLMTTPHICQAFSVLEFPCCNYKFQEENLKLSCMIFFISYIIICRESGVFDFIMTARIKYLWNILQSFKKVIQHDPSVLFLLLLPRFKTCWAIQPPTSRRFLFQKAEDGERQRGSSASSELFWILRGASSRYVPPPPTRLRTAPAARALVPSATSP